MNATVKSKWTAADEAALHELTERKQRIMSERRGEVHKVAELVYFHNMLIDELTDALIANADALRDALAPFDSGVRLG